MSPTKQQKLVADLVPYVVVVNATSDGSYPSDLTDTADVEAQVKVATPPPLLEVPLLNTIQENPLVNLPSLKQVQLKIEPVSLDCHAAVSSVVGGNCTTASIGTVTTVTSTAGETSAAVLMGDESIKGHEGIFKNAKPSNSDMEWTSDESDCIATAESFEGLVTTVYSMESPKPAPSTPKMYRRKWTEEEHACLLEGVRILGEGKWKEIKNMYHDVLKDRECVHLKDRYRNTEGKRGKKREQKPPGMT